MNIIIMKLRSYILPKPLMQRGLGVGLLLLALVVGACSSDDDIEEPTPNYLTVGTDQRPTDWIAPAPSLYGGITMAVQVQLGDTLAHFQSSGDLMCAKIDNEVRAVTHPFTNGTITYFPLSIVGDGDSNTISLHYYCDRLHRIYTITNWATFDINASPMGDSQLYRPRFTEN